MQKIKKMNKATYPPYLMNKQTNTGEIIGTIW